MSMFGLKKYVVGIFIGLLFGLWMGVNIGKNQPLWASPFAKRSLAEQAQTKANEVIKDAKKAMREKLKD